MKCHLITRKMEQKTCCSRVYLIADKVGFAIALPLPSIKTKSPKDFLDMIKSRQAPLYRMYLSIIAIKMPSVDNAQTTFSWSRKRGRFSKKEENRKENQWLVGGLFSFPIPKRNSESSLAESCRSRKLTKASFDRLLLIIQAYKAWAG